MRAQVVIVVFADGVRYLWGRKGKRWKLNRILQHERLTEEVVFLGRSTLDGETAGYESVQTRPAESLRLSGPRYMQLGG